MVDDAQESLVNNTTKVLTNDGSESGHLPNTRLTESERRILSLIVDEHLAPRQIVRREKCSRAYVSKVLTSLRKKGALGLVNNTPVNNTSTLTGLVNHPLRLHAEEFTVRLLGAQPRYFEARNRCSSKLVDGNRVVLYRDSLVIFSGQSFTGPSREACEREASAYYERFFHRLENDLGVLILKERAENVRLVRYHYAELGNELAQDLRKRKEKMRFFGSKDGKEWMLFDDSFKGDEAEFTHAPTLKEPKAARDDVVKFQAHFNDVRDHDLLKPSQLQFLVQQQLEVTGRVIQNQQVFDRNMMTHLDVLKKLGEGVELLSLKVGQLPGRARRREAVQHSLGRWV